MDYAILDDNHVVLNIIVASDAFCQMVYPNHWVKLAPGQWCDMGAIYDPTTNTFSPAS